MPPKTKSIIIFLLILSFTIAGFALYSYHPKINQLTGGQKIIETANAATTISAVSCNQADVQAAVNSAVNGDVVNVPSGSCSWSGTLIINKNIILQGAGSSSTLISGGSIKIPNNSPRITGFGFISTTIKVNGNGWRIDNNAFTVPSRVYVITVGEETQYAQAHPTGLIDHNTFTKAAIVVFGTLWQSSYNDQSWLWGIPTGLGTATNVVFIEDNIFTSGSQNEYSFDSMDSNYGGRFVLRHNKMYNTDTSLHGIQSTTNRAVSRFEIYNNSYTTTIANWTALQVRSGPGVIYGNTFTGPYNTNIIIDNQTSAFYDLK